MKNLSLCILFFACSSPSIEDFQKRGDHWAKQMVLLLQDVETGEDLKAKEKLLQKKYLEIVDIMVAAKKTIPKNHYEFAATHHVKKLKKELDRIHAISDGAEILERAQREARFRLDLLQQKNH